ncbi:MAG TPA: polyphosphate kinase 2 family protein [Thermomicrobiales bacterium]|nr:polyphosphate kinase 2 family protein [Thermomicrobiales bacterium]
MAVSDEIIRQMRVEPGTPANIRGRDAAWRGEEYYPGLDSEELMPLAKQRLDEFVEELAHAQKRLWADDTYALLLVFQALDAAGKDGTIKHVMTGVNPQGCQVFSFKKPSSEDLDHTYLWRYSKGLPERGRIGIFNRSYYEEVLVVRVHPEILQHQKHPPSAVGPNMWEERFEDINAFERHLDRNGTKILKFFLNVSWDEQRNRFLRRIDNPDKNWKFSSGDIAERQFWDQYTDAFEDALTKTSTPWAPWYVIPADHKWITHAVVGGIIVNAIESLNLSYPQATAEQIAGLSAARERLTSERRPG